MINKNIFLINSLTIIFIAITIFKAIYISVCAYNYNIVLSFKNVWILPVLVIVVYIILTFFIKHPKYLLKKELPDVENPNLLKQDILISKWKNYYYYYRLILVTIITLIYVFQ